MKFPDVGGPRSSVSKKDGVFISLKDGEKIEGVFKGEPHIFKQHWTNKKSILCEGKDCLLCLEGDTPKFRFKINLITLDKEGFYTPRIFEQGYGTYTEMKALHEGEYELDKTVVSITRRGEGTDTRYKILPVKNQLPEDKIALLDKVPLLDLKAKKK